MVDPGLILIDVLNGLSKGFFYFLIVSGLTLTLGIMGIINFAHGAFYMVGGYTAYTLARVLAGTGCEFWLAAVISAVIVSGAGFLVERFLLRRIYAAEHLYQLLLTFGLVFLLEGLVLQIWGGTPRSIFQPEFLMGSLIVAGRSWPKYSLFLLLFSAALAAGLWYLLYRTRLGRSTRASAMDKEMTRALGINVPQVFTIMFVIGTFLAALAGGTGTALRSLTLGMGAEIIILCFAIVVIGGMGSLVGALIGSLILGMFESFGWHYFPDLAMMLPYLLMTVVLIIRPRGLLGKE